MHHPVPNNFTYADDQAGRKCPHLAHIRRMNGRTGDGPVLARRGQTYGRRTPDRPLPSAGVGLLFMAAVADVEAQFERLQRAANGADGGAVDPLIGQVSGAEAPLGLPPAWGGEAPGPAPGEPSVRLLGGEYFFLPSLPFLRSL
jgi:hypothetical protein